VKRYRLLVDWHLVARIEALPAAQRRELYRRFDRLEEAPDSASEFETQDGNGRTLNAFIVGDIDVLYWIDFADRHVKVLAMTDAS
jgi:hypothetical protein